MRPYSAPATSTFRLHGNICTAGMTAGQVYTDSTTSSRYERPRYSRVIATQITTSDLLWHGLHGVSPLFSALLFSGRMSAVRGSQARQFSLRIRSFYLYFFSLSVYLTLRSKISLRCSMFRSLRISCRSSRP